MEFPEEWKNWHFYGRYLCSPNGDRFKPTDIMAVFMYRQSDMVRVLIQNPEYVKLMQEVRFLHETKKIEAVESTTAAFLDITLPLPFPKTLPVEPSVLF